MYFGYLLEIATQFLPLNTSLTLALMSARILTSSMSEIPYLACSLHSCSLPHTSILSLCPFILTSYSHIFPFSLFSFLDFKAGGGRSFSFWAPVLFWIHMSLNAYFSGVFLKILWPGSLLFWELKMAQQPRASHAVSTLGSNDSTVGMSLEPKLPGFGILPVTSDMCDHEHIIFLSKPLFAHQ